jgi:chemotaxis protein histidine kinase CheA
VRRVAHTLKGHFRIFGSHKAADHALQIELHARDADLDVSELIASLEREAELVSQELREFLSTRPSLAASPSER